MNIERQVQQRSMLGGVPPVVPPFGVDGKISGIAPGCSSGVPPVAGSLNIVSALAVV
jgi:hypothetical protein